MKAITLHQPWASLVALGEKRIEARSWQTHYRGPIAIHAGLAFTDGQQALMRDEPFRSVLHAARHLRLSHLPRGFVVATAELWDVRAIFSAKDPIPEQFGAKHERSFGDYREGRYAWLLRNVVALELPIGAKGGLGVWDWNRETGQVQASSGWQSASW